MINRRLPQLFENEFGQISNIEKNNNDTLFKLSFILNIPDVS